MTVRRTSAAELATNENVTTLLIKLQEKRGPKKRALSDLLGVAASTLSHALRAPGDDVGPRLWRAHEVTLLARHYGVSTDIFFGVDEDGRRALLAELEHRLNHPEGRT